MPYIGVRELREKTTQVIRDVRENRARYIVTLRGRPVAVILPMTEADVAESGWSVYEKLAEQIRREWPKGLSTQEIMDEVRR